MGVSGDENVHVELALNESEALRVAPRYHLVAVTQTDPELAHRHHLLLGVVHVLRG